MFQLKSEKIKKKKKIIVEHHKKKENKEEEKKMRIHMPSGINENACVERKWKKRNALKKKIKNMKLQ